MKAIVTLISGCALMAAATGTALAQQHGYSGNHGGNQGGNRGGNYNRGQSGAYGGGHAAAGTYGHSSGYQGGSTYRGNGPSTQWRSDRGRPSYPAYQQHRNNHAGWNGGPGRSLHGGIYYPNRGYAGHGGYRGYHSRGYYSYDYPYYVAPPVVGYYAPTYYDYPYYEPPVYLSQQPPYVVVQTRPSAPPPPPPQPQYLPAPLAQAMPAPLPAAPRAEARPAPRIDRVTLSANELFDFDKAALKSPQPKLDEIAYAMRENPQISNVHVTGHTDRLGSTSYNRKLSQKRAEAVKDYLVAKGVEPKRLIAIGRGEADPVVNCADTKRAGLIRCLEPNRRVEVEQITFERSH